MFTLALASLCLKALSTGLADRFALIAYGVLGTWIVISVGLALFWLDLVRWIPILESF